MNLDNVGKCNLCGCNLFEKVADKLRDNTDDYKIYRCKSCGHIQLLPCPAINEDKKFYDEDKQEKAIRPERNIDKLRINNRYDVHRRADFIVHRFSKDKKILDVGCGYGFFLEEMTSRGYTIRGIEISKERRVLAKTITNIPIIDIDFTEPYKWHEQYDIVTLFHVLEHIIDPVSFCGNIYNVLNKDGCLIVEVPNVDEFMLATCSAYHKFYWIRAHINYFSKKTLEKVLKAAGFKKIKIMYVQRYGVENLCNWLMTGTPQFEEPVFEIDGSYRWLEDHYRKHLMKIGRSDTLVALVYK